MSRLKQEILSSVLGTASADTARHTCSYCFAPEFVGFQGHFPGHPVLPAFVQVLAAQTAMELRNGGPLPLQQVKRAKFMKTIHPGDEVGIHWSEEVEAGNLVGRVTVTVSGEKAAVFTLCLGRS